MTKAANERRTVLIIAVIALFAIVFAMMLTPATAHAKTTSSFEAKSGQTVSVDELGGENRYATNMDIIQSNYSSTTNMVILATGESFPDALSASTLAGVLDAPIVLTASYSLSSEAKATLQKFKPSKLIVVGSTAAVSQAVVSEAERAAEVTKGTTRLGGKNRYETNAKIYDYLINTCGINASKEIILATGENFADALSISSYAAYAKVPVILCNSKGIDAGLKKVLKIYSGQITIVGSTAAVSKENANSFPKAKIKRIGGKDRFETSNLIANYTISKGFSAKTTLFATGHNFPDALSGGSVGAKLLAPIVLLNNNSAGIPKSETAYSYCNDNAATITNITYLGSTAAIGTPKRDAVRCILQGQKSFGTYVPAKGHYEYKKTETIRRDRVTLDEVVTEYSGGGSSTYNAERDIDDYLNKDLTGKTSGVTEYKPGTLWFRIHYYRWSYQNCPSYTMGDFRVRSLWLTYKSNITKEIPLILPGTTNASIKSHGSATDEYSTVVKVTKKTEIPRTYLKTTSDYKELAKDVQFKKYLDNEILDKPTTFYYITYGVGDISWVKDRDGYWK